MRVALKDGEPFFCAMDICRILQYENGRDTIWKFFPKGVARIKTPTNGGLQELTYLTEPQLYKLIMRSHAKNAEPLQDCLDFGHFAKNIGLGRNKMFERLRSRVSVRRAWV